MILRLKEVRAYREKYEEILRLGKGSETMRIGRLKLNGHKLRVSKGGTTYGIPLLDVDDPEASPLRIYDGSSIRGFPKAD